MSGLLAGRGSLSKSLVTAASGVPTESAGLVACRCKSVDEIKTGSEEIELASCVVAAFHAASVAWKVPLGVLPTQPTRACVLAAGAYQSLKFDPPVPHAKLV